MTVVLRPRGLSKTHIINIINISYRILKRAKLKRIGTGNPPKLSEQYLHISQMMKKN